MPRKKSSVRPVKGGKSSPTKKPSQKKPIIDYMEDGQINSPPEKILEYAVLIFGEKGIGKTTLAGNVPGSYINQYELRRRSAKVRQTNIPIHSATKLGKMKAQAKRSGKDFFTSWQMIQAAHDLQLADDSVECIIEDTIDGAWKACMAHICFNKGIEDPTEANDYGQTWRQLKDEFLSEYERILDAGKGLWFISHATFKEVELRGDDKYELLVPTCEKGAFEFLKQVVDFAFYYGYHQGTRRVLRLRGNEDIWAACAVDDHFCYDDGTPLEMIEMGTNPTEAYERMQDAFDNKVPAPKKRTKTSRRRK